MTKHIVPNETPVRREEPLVVSPVEPRREPQRPVPSYPKEPVRVGVGYRGSIEQYPERTYSAHMR